jgi:1-acyl-sn-glycerol-3-phosphate acyltransferase
MGDADVISLDDHRDDHDHDHDQVPPGFSGKLSDLIGAAQRFVTGLAELPMEQLRTVADDPLRELLGLLTRAGVDWSGTTGDVADYIRHRMSGDYAVDEFGFDPEFTTTIVLPALRQVARTWFRVEVQGAENIPTDGAALLVANHAGTLPIDALILQSVIFDEVERHARNLGADLVFETPYVGDFARKIGVTLACQEDAERLLGSGELVTVFPEGFKGLGKLYSERYKLQRFGRGGFVSAAVRAGVPIVPISIVGSEEIYPQIGQLPTLARILGVPYFPVTPLFPLLGVIGMIPLPSKWIIRFGEQIATDELPQGAAEDPMVVFNVTDQVRDTIQHSLYELLNQRRGIFS